MNSFRRYIPPFCALFLFFIVLYSCTSDKLPEPSPCEGQSISYNSSIKPILDQSCAYSGCHDGQGGIAPGDYSSYAGLTSVLDRGAFRSRVISQKDDPCIGMPPDQSCYPNSQKDDLTPDELQQIDCWLREGYPE